jgi:hypothetical protein
LEDIAGKCLLAPVKTVVESGAKPLRSQKLRPAMSSQAKPQPQAEPPVLRLFISYASEDVGIALAIAKGLREALGDGFAEVSMDKWFLQAGDVFKKELEAKLEKTNELVIVYTGVDKQSHSYTGWEVGYFERGMKSHP